VAGADHQDRSAEGRDLCPPAHPFDIRTTRERVVIAVVEAARVLVRRANIYGRLDLDHEVSELHRLYGLDEARALRAIELAAARGQVLRRSGEDGRTVLVRPSDWRAELAAIEEAQP
jgi:hypothetical protein